jgi:L-fuculose-phosphate aldolase
MSIKEDLVKVCHLVYERGFVSATDGNISAANSDETFFITRSGVRKGDVTEDDILEIDLHGNILRGKGKISTENKIHLNAYSKRKDVKAVVHCHPVFATAFATVGEDFTKHYFPEFVLTLGKVHLCKYATPSTEELSKSMNPYLDYSWAFLLQNHGAVTLGKNLFDAFNKMEKLEHTAKILFVAQQLGTLNELTSEKVKELLSIAKQTYALDVNEKNIF